MVNAKNLMAIFVICAGFAACSRNETEQRRIAATTQERQAESRPEGSSPSDPKDQYLIRPHGLGKFDLGMSLDELRKHFPIAEVEPIGEEKKSFLIKLAGSDKWDLRADVDGDEVVAFYLWSSRMYTEKGVRPEKTRFADLVRAYNVKDDDLYIPDAGELIVAVDELPFVSFVFEHSELMKFAPETRPKLKDIPQTITLYAVYVVKRLQ